MENVDILTEYNIMHKKTRMDGRPESILNYTTQSNVKKNTFDQYIWVLFNPKSNHIMNLLKKNRTLIVVIFSYKML